MHIVKVGDYLVGQGNPLMLMAGPCVLEGYERSLMIGQKAKAICDELGVPYVFKASFDKANRSSIKSFRGPGIDEGLKILAQIKKDLGVPVVTDIHEPWHADKAAEVVDILQRNARTPNDSPQGILGNDEGDIGLILQTFVEALNQSTTTCQVDTIPHNIGVEFGGNHLQHLTERALGHAVDHLADAAAEQAVGTL